MHHTRAYSYDDQGGHYPSEHIPRHQNQFPYSATPQYERSYHQPQSSSQYYMQNTDIAPADPYYRSMTPGMPQTSMHRQPQNVSQTHYSYSSASGRPSTSSYDPAPYSSQDVYYQGQQSQYSREPRSHHSGMSSPLSEAAFIPTPSEMYNNYPPQQITVPPHSPTPAPYGISQYPQHSPKIEQRPARISIGRPQTSPTSGSSASGERFQCDQCPKTFSRSHDRKRHHETQHQERPVIHRCRYCHKEFSRADSLKRHLDNGCDEMPQ